MKFLALGLLALSLNCAFAQEKMSEDAIEMMNVMSNPVANDCVRQVGRMINVEIEKSVYRCPGCTTYVITGNKLGIDTPSPDKTTITLAGRGIRTQFGFAQNFTCDIK